MEKQKDFMDKEATSFHIAESKASRLQYQEETRKRQEHSLELLEQSELEARISRRRHCVPWLPFDIRDQDEHRERISSRRHDDTCKWIVRVPLLKSWIRDDSRSRIIWLNGKPGTGMHLYTIYMFINPKLTDEQHRKQCHVFLYCRKPF